MLQRTQCFLRRRRLRSREAGSRWIQGLGDTGPNRRGPQSQLNASENTPEHKTQGGVRGLAALVTTYGVGELSAVNGIGESSDVQSAMTCSPSPSLASHQYNCLLPLAPPIVALSGALKSHFLNSGGFCGTSPHPTHRWSIFSTRSDINRPFETFRSERPTRSFRRAVRCSTTPLEI